MVGKQEIFDGERNEWLDFRPLGHESRRVVSSGMGDQAMHVVAAMGTCGDPSNPDYSSHRTEVLYPALEQLGVNPDKVRSPEVKEWEPKRAEVESVWGARADVLSIPVTNQTKGAASIAEAGLLTYGAILRGQDAHTFIQLDDETPDETFAARGLALSILKATAARFPLFTVSDSVETLAQRVAVSFSDMERIRGGNVAVRREYELPPIRSDLEPAIYLSGSMGKARPAWLDTLTDKIHTLYEDAIVKDSHDPNWDVSSIAGERADKLDCAVQIEVVTADEPALGALAETGPRIMQADLSGQSFGLLIEPHHDSAPNSDSNRTRTLVRAHLDRLQADFPNTELFVTDNPNDLALFAVGEYVQQRARLKRQR